jgi:FkbM family methyltransferase
MTPSASVALRYPENGRLDPPFGSFRPSSLQESVIGLVRATFLRRGTFRPTMSSLVQSLRPGPIDTMFSGAAFRLHVLGSAAECAILCNPSYNRRELDFLSDELPPDGTFVDIGANVGLYSLALAARLGPAGKVVAVEPDAIACDRLLANRLASAARHVIVMPVAAGDSDGEVRFAHEGDNLGHSRVTEDGSVRVPMRTLQAILAEAQVDRIDALKIDVEGLEDRVLLPFFRGAPRTQWPRRMVVEDEYAAQWREDCMAYLKDLGYRVAARSRSNAFLLGPGGGARA